MATKQTMKKSPKTSAKAVRSKAVAAEEKGASPRQRDMAQAFRRLRSRLGRTPNSSEWQEHTEYSLGQVQRAFGSWGAFLTAVGGVATRAVDHKAVNRQSLIADYQRLKKKLGHPPSSIEINRWGNYSSSSYALVFGSISSFRERMGDSPIDGRAELTPRKVEQAYRKLESELKRPPVSFELAERLGVCRRTLLRHIGSYKRLVQKLSRGEPLPRRRNRAHRRRIGDEELVKEYRRLEKKLGHTPSFDEMNEHGAYSPTLYVVRFGSWSSFIKKMGGKQRLHRLEVTRDQAEKVYRRLSDSLGRRPTLLEVCDEMGISVRGFYNHFGLFKKFCRAITERQI